MREAFPSIGSSKIFRTLTGKQEFAFAGMGSSRIFRTMTEEQNIFCCYSDYRASHRVTILKLEGRYLSAIFGLKQGDKEP